MTEVSSGSTSEVYGKCINMQTVIVYDKTGTSSITLFDMYCNQTNATVRISLLTSHSASTCLWACSRQQKSQQ